MSGNKLTSYWNGVAIKESEEAKYWEMEAHRQEKLTRKALAEAAYEKAKREALAAELEEEIITGEVMLKFANAMINSARSKT